MDDFNLHFSEDESENGEEIKKIIQTLDSTKEKKMENDEEEVDSEHGEEAEESEHRERDVDNEHKTEQTRTEHKKYVSYIKKKVGSK